MVGSIDYIKKLKDLYHKQDKDNLERLKTAFKEEIRIIDEVLKSK